MNETMEKVVQEFESRAIAVVEPRQNSLLDIIERLASNPDVDIAKFQALVKINEDSMDRSEKQEYNAAMVKAQRRIPTVLKNKDNQQTNSRYADFDAVTKVAKPIYTEEGFAISFHEGYATPEKPIPDNHIRMIADVMHEAGHTEIKEADIPLDSMGIKGTVNKTGPHAKGSSFQYGRRYMTCMIFGISTGDDDDGNSAGGVEYITLDQETEINDLLTETKTNLPAFLKLMGANSVDKILARNYSKAVNFFQDKKRKAT